VTARRTIEIPLPASVRDAQAAGINEHRLRAFDLAAPFHGVRLEKRFENDFDARCAALVTKMRPGDAFTGPTGARIWGMPLPMRLLRLDEPLHVSSMLPVRPLRRRGVIGSLREPSGVEVVRGLPVLCPLRVWFSLAGTLSFGDLVAAGDFLVTGDRGQGAHAGPGDLVSFATAMARHPGAPRARAAAAASRRGAWSRPETLLRLLAIDAGLPEPELNQPLVTLGGGVLLPDLRWPRMRLAAEYNGEGHETPDQRRRDLRRMDDYAELGWRVVNVDASELFGAPAPLEARLRRAYEQCAKAARIAARD
jgi:hypothetical protein